MHFAHERGLGVVIGAKMRYDGLEQEGNVNQRASGEFRTSRPTIGVPVNDPIY